MFILKQRQHAEQVKAQSLLPMHFYIMAKYTILKTWHKYGSISQIVKKEQVKNICENSVKTEKLLQAYRANKGEKNEDLYIRIEVINNETGEIREYWNNKENKIKF